jgi:hypothetical protein
MSASDFLDEWFVDDRVKGALATQAIIGAWCGPMSPGSAYVLMHHWIGEVDGHEGAWGWVHGGMGGLSQALAGAARAAGAEIRVGAAVRRVDVRGGRAAGVELDDGTVIAARRVVSSAHPITTYRDLVGFEHLPDDVVRDVRRLRTRSGSVKVNLTLSGLPRPTAWDSSRPEQLHRGPTPATPPDHADRANPRPHGDLPRGFACSPPPGKEEASPARSCRDARDRWYLPMAVRTAHGGQSGQYEAGGHLRAAASDSGSGNTVPGIPQHAGPEFCRTVQLGTVDHDNQLSAQVRMWLTAHDLTLHGGTEPTERQLFG